MDVTRLIDDVEQSPDSLGRLADALDRGLEGLDQLPVATRLLILGMGSSAYAAASVARVARSHGVNVIVELASTGVLPPPSPDLAVIAVSATGSSVELLQAAEAYRGGLLAVTNRIDSPLAEMADAVVPLHADIEVSGVASRTFRHTIVVLAEVLTHFGARFNGAAMARSGARANAALLDSRGDWLNNIAHTLLGPSGSFVLAPNDRLASAQQAALMVREVPRRPAYASETGDWSHVDVYLTKTLDYRALMFAGSVWDSQAIEWMRDRGSTLVSVGADHDFATHTVRYPGDGDWATASLAEVTVAELVAAQWHAQDPNFGWSAR